MTRTAVAARVLPFTDDKLLELLSDGKDVESIADAWEYAALKRKHAYLDAIEFADTHPVQPVSERTKVLATAERQQARIGHCPESWLPGIGTGDGRGYGKELVCGREWCPVCGHMHSVAHKRRMFCQHKRKGGKVGLSWYDKLSQLKSAGYFVIEMPLRGRVRWHSKASLERAGKLATSVLKGDYEIKQRRTSGEVLRKDEVGRIHRRWYDRQLRRWHYFGDVAKNIQQVIDVQAGIKQLPLSDEFSTKRFNPHLNILVPGGYLPTAKLDYIKAMLKAAFSESDLIVHYSFTDEPSRMVHLLSYVTRATFLDIAWDKYLAGSLYDFRNMRSCGVWDAEAVWTLSDLNSQAKGIIAGVDIDALRRIGRGLDTTGKPIKWSRPVPISLLRYIKEHCSEDFIDYGAGFCSFKLTMPERLEFESDTMHWQKLLNTALARVRTDERCELLSRHDRHELSLVKTQSGQNEGVLADCSGSVSQKAIQTDKTSAGIRQTNLFDSVVSRSPIKACRIPASLNSCSGWAVVELPTHQQARMVEV